MRKKKRKERPNGYYAIGIRHDLRDELARRYPHAQSWDAAIREALGMSAYVRPPRNAGLQRFTVKEAAE